MEKEAINTDDIASLEVTAAIENAEDTILIDMDNITNKNIYPAAMRFQNSIVVASVNNLVGKGNVELSDFSNYGRDVVHIAAPGEDIISTVPGFGEDTLSGTSMATPFVANVVAKMLMVNPKLSSAKIREILMKTGDKIPTLKEKVMCGCVINPDRAIKMASDFKN